MKLVLKYFQKNTLILILGMLLGIQSVFLCTKIIEVHFEFGKNSDLLYPVVFWDDVFSNKKLNWIFPPAFELFPGLIIFGISKVLNGNNIFGYYFYTIGFSFLLWWALFNFTRHWEIEDYTEEWEDIIISSKEIKIFISFLISYTFIIICYFFPIKMGLFFFIGFHGVAFLTLPIVNLFFNFQKSDFFIILIFILCMIGDSHIWTQIVIPAFLSFILIYTQFKNKIKFNFPKELLIGIFIGIILQKIILSNPFFKTPDVPIFSTLKSFILNGKLFENFLNGFILFIQDDFGFSEIPFLKFIWIGFYLLIIYLFYKSNLNVFERFCLYFFLSSIFISLLFQFSIGVWMGPRYVWSFYLGPINLLPMLLFKKESGKKLGYAIGIFQFIFLVGISLYSKLYFNFPVTKEVECVIKYAEQKKTTFAISNYWNAKYYKVASNYKIKTIPYFNKIEPYYWITNLEDFQVQEKIYLILITGLQSHSVLSKYGQPTETKVCDKMEIYFYENGIDHLK
ncbi:MAG: hypothetical protein IPL26_18270 [Leptospiraceae bacterium]|nr:hypothetical protein [Leptospiraceae bacterium]